MPIDKSHFVEIAEFIQKNGKRSIDGSTPTAFIAAAIRQLALVNKAGEMPPALFDALRAAIHEFGVSFGEIDDNDALFRTLGERLTNIARERYGNLLPVLFKWLWDYDRATAFYILQRIGFDFWEMLLAERQSAGEVSTKTDIFICWSGDYAEAIARHIREFFRPHAHLVNVFLSSTDIQRGVWRDRLRGGLAQATEGIVIATQDLLDSQYIQYEFALLSEKAEDPLVLLFGCPRTVLPTQMQTYQCVDYDRGRLEEWARRVLGPLGTFPSEQFEALVQKLEATIREHGPRFVTSDPERWLKAYHRPLGMAAQKDSPYDREQSIRVARQHLVLVAQNHWHMTDAKLNNPSRYWLLIRDALLRGVDIDVVAMHEAARPTGNSADEVPDAVEVWGLYHEKRSQFRTQLRQAWQTFEDWHKVDAELRAGSDGNLGQLKFYGVYFAPVTMTFVDPENSRGFAVISPRPPSRESADRPQFILRKKWEPSMFAYYWRTVEDSMANANWLDQPFDDV